VTYDSEVDTIFVVHCSQFGLPDSLFEMHPCGLHICYPQNCERQPDVFQQAPNCWCNPCKGFI
jgi:hypothetical protein